MRLLGEYFGIGIDELEPEEVPIGNLEDRSRTIFPNNTPVVKYIQNKKIN